MFNPKFKKGVIFHKLRNARNARNAAKKTNQNNEEGCSMSGEELKSFLKYCVVQNDKAKLKNVLRETVSIRRQLLAVDDDELKDFWNFYFVDVDLVIILFYLVFF